MNIQTREAALMRLQTALRTLDEGAYQPALRQFEAGKTFDETEYGALWVAELHLYMNRLDRAEAIADDLAEALEPALRSDDVLGELARRRRLIAAEVAYFEGRYTDAEALVGPTLGAASAAEDDYATMRGRYTVGRILRRQARYQEAIDELGESMAMAEELGNDFYRGLNEFNRASCSFELNEIMTAAAQFERATALLKGSESLRYTSMCESGYGILLTDMERIDDAMELFAHAERITESLAIERDSLFVSTNIARALLSAERYEEAEQRLERLVEMERALQQQITEFHTLCLLSIARAARGKFAESADAARAALGLSEMVGNDYDRLDAETLLARAEARNGKKSAVEKLRKLVKQSETVGTENHVAQAKVFLAQAILSSDSMEARKLAEQVRALPVIEAAGWLTRELERLEHDLNSAPIHIDDRGRLVVDATKTWPTLPEARDAVERYLFDLAMKASRGNKSAAGRLIGQSPYQMWQLSCEFSGKVPRPSRSKQPDAADKKPERRRARKRPSHQPKD